MLCLYSLLIAIVVSFIILRLAQPRKKPAPMRSEPELPSARPPPLSSPVPSPQLPGDVLFIIATYMGGTLRESTLIGLCAKAMDQAMFGRARHLTFTSKLHPRYD